MPPLENEEVVGAQPSGDDDENRGEKTLSGPIIGIIYPPPEVRSILNLKKKKNINNKHKPFQTFRVFCSTICIQKLNFYIIFLNHNFKPKILLTKPLVSLQEMVRNSRQESDKMSWAIQNSTSWIQAIRTTHTISIKWTNFGKENVRTKCCNSVSLNLH